MDRPEVEAVVSRAYALYLERMTARPAPMLDDYAALIDRGVVHVGILDASVVGVLVGWPESDHFFIDNVAVDPERQGTGAGATLLGLADTLARAAGHDEIRLYTNEAMTENLAYYPRRGFVETHRANDAGYDRVFFRRRLA